jgi:hypothetical protein
MIRSSPQPAFIQTLLFRARVPARVHLLSLFVSVSGHCTVRTVQDQRTRGCSRSRSIFGGGSRFPSLSCFSALASHRSHTGCRVNASNGFGSFFSLECFRCFPCFPFHSCVHPAHPRTCKNQICHTNTIARLTRITFSMVIRFPPRWFRMTLHDLHSPVNHPHPNGSVPHFS